MRSPAKLSLTHQYSESESRLTPALTDARVCVRVSRTRGLRLWKIQVGSQVSGGTEASNGTDASCNLSAVQA